MHVIDIRDAHIRVVGNPFEDDHLAGLPFKGLLHGRPSDLERLRDIHPGDNMGRASLK